MLSGLVPPSAARADDGTEDYCKNAAAATPSGHAILCLTFPSEPGQNQIITSSAFEARRAAVPDPGVTDSRYRVRSPTHPDSDYSVTISGYSIRQLISEFAQPGTLGRTTFTTTNLPVSRSTYLSVLDHDDLHQSSGFQDGLFPAVYFVSGDPGDPTDPGNFGYVRPLRDGSDDNIDDAFIDNQYLHVVVHTDGEVLHPSITVAGTQKAGQALTLTASIPESTSTGLHYRWTLGDRSSQPPDSPDVPPHVFAPGTWYPSVVVTGDDTSYGYAQVSNPIQIDPAQSGGTGPGGGKGNPIAPPSGPRNGDGSKAGGGSTRSGGTGDQPGSGPGTSTPSGATGAGPGVGSAPATAGPSSAPRTAGPSAGRTSSAGAPPPGALVSGLVLAAPRGAVQPAGSSEAVDQAQATAARPRSSDRLDLRWLLWLIPAGLIALGVFGEQRRPHRRDSTP